MADSERCPLCGHPWTSHDPEDGCCDAPADESFQPCPCGRDLAWVQNEVTRLSRAALESEAERKLKSKMYGYHTLKLKKVKPGDAVVRFGDWRKHEPQILLDRQQWAALGAFESMTMEIS